MKTDSASPEWDPFGGRFFGIWNVEGEGEPLVLFPRRQVFPCDVTGAAWNSYEPEPRELTLAEIVAIQGGGL